MTTIYLAGPVSNEHAPHELPGSPFDTEYDSWRAEVVGEYPDNDYLDPTEGFRIYQGQRIFRGRPIADAAIVEMDFEKIASADALLVGDTGARSPGTWREVEHALSVVDIPVAVWALEAIYDADLTLGDYYLASSPFLRSAGVVSTDLAECMDYLGGDDG